jgi:undecaprenyl diphosphate synthase
MADKTQTLPVHLGIILDGNRRWAKKQGLPLTEGHRQGGEVFKDIALAAFDRGIAVVSAYIFSTENWQRTQDEVAYLMSLVAKGITKYLEAFNKANIKLVLVGARQGVDVKVLSQIGQAIERTKDNTGGILALCFNYGGQEEIVAAAQALLDDGQKAVTTASLAARLYAPELPPLDLIIRTSGEQRLSGFMLWRAAYAELYFTSVLWPDFTPKDLDVALADYAARQRRFGS